MRNVVPTYCMQLTGYFWSHAQLSLSISLTVSCTCLFCFVSIAHILYCWLDIFTIPPGLCEEEFYARLFQSMDVEHYIIHDQNPPIFGEDCLNIFESIGFHYTNSSSQELCDIMRKKGTYVARQCRLNLPIVVNRAILKTTLLRAEANRLNCLYSHPLYQ